MRWTYKDEPKEGDTRKSLVFAFFPEQMVDGTIVWLERYVKHERFEYFTNQHGRHYETNEIRPAWVITMRVARAK